MNLIIHKYNLEIYKTHIRFVFDREVMEKVSGDDLTGSAGFTFWPHQSDTIWIYQEKKDGFIDVCTASHECYHAADYICQRTGMTRTDDDSNEHIAYLIGHLMYKLLDALDRDNEWSNK